MAKTMKIGETRKFDTKELAKAYVTEMIIEHGYVFEQVAIETGAGAFIDENNKVKLLEKNCWI